MRSGDREIPYSLVTAIDLRARSSPAIAARRRDASRAGADSTADRPERWAARDLGVKVGDPLTLEYYVWEEPGRLVTRTADFEVAAIVPIAGAAADRDLAPVYPGITERRRLARLGSAVPDRSAARPPRRRRLLGAVPHDAEGVHAARGRAARCGDRATAIAHRFASTPTAGEPIAAARDRFAARAARRDRSASDWAWPCATCAPKAWRRRAARPTSASTSPTSASSSSCRRCCWPRCSSGSAVEQRAREVGLLRAVGFSTARVRRLFSGEGLVLALAGSAHRRRAARRLRGADDAGLRTWWVGAVGTTALTLHVSPSSLARGAAGALVAAMACIWWTLRGLARVSERSLLAGELESRSRRSPAGVGERPRPVATVAVAGRSPRSSFAALGVALMAASAAGALDRTGGVLRRAARRCSSPCLCARRVGSAARRARPSPGTAGARLPGSACATPPIGRAAACSSIAVIASATFILISVDAFRRGAPDATDRHSGIGGYPLLVDSLLPLVTIRTAATAASRSDSPLADQVDDRALPRCCPATTRAA